MVDGAVVGAGVGFRVTASLVTEVQGHVAPPPVTDSESTSNACKSCIVRSRKRTVTWIVVMPNCVLKQSSLGFWRRVRLSWRNPPKKSEPGQSSISILVLSSAIALPCEAVSVSRTALMRAAWSASLPVARALSSGQSVSITKVGLSFSSVGAGVGLPVIGAGVGSEVNGAEVGAGVGPGVGAGVGPRVGSSVVGVGAEVGLGVGPEVGFMVGAAIGA